MSEKRALRVYMAGDLFDSKDLAGNLLLAAAVEKESCGRYEIMLPQDGECEVSDRSSQSIRDADFKLLYNSDVIVANFDGTDLDSGTVVEFCFAKMVDMPAVLLRTDFRNSGDHTLADGDPWNLMCSHYPRTKVCHINGMMFYHECKSGRSSAAGILEGYYKAIACRVIEALDEVVKMPSWLNAVEVLPLYEHAVTAVGGTLPQIFDAETLADIVDSKISAGLY